PIYLNGLSVGILLPAVSLGLAFGMASGTVYTLSVKRQMISSSQQMGGVLVGSLVGGLIYGLAYTLPFWAIEGQASYRTAVIVSGAVFGLTSVLSVGWRTGRWRRSIFLGLTFCAVIVLSGQYATQDTIRQVALRLICWVANCEGYGFAYYAGTSLIFLSTIVSAGAPYVLAYTLGEQMAGPKAGAVAAMFGASGTMITLFTTFDPSTPSCNYMPNCFLPPVEVILPIAFVATFGTGMLMFAMPLWRPVLTYPLTEIWNLILYNSDLRRWRRGELPAKQSRLRLHSAFWDESQRLPLWGLAEYVTWVVERFPDEGRQALAYLIGGNQGWAATAAQLELDARQLERVAPNIKAIGRAHRHLAIGELNDPARPLLRSFKRHSQDVDAALNQATLYHKRLALRGVEERLENFLRELTRSNEQHTARFYSIASRWYQAVLDHQELLAETAELQDEIDNPYIFGVPLTEEQDIFVGRREISERIEQLVLDPRRPPLLLYGQRRMGKTSLLRSLGRLLPSNIIPLFVDGEGLAGASNYADFVYNIAWQISQSAAQRELTLSMLDRQTLEAGPFTRFITWLDEIENQLKQHGFNMALLTLDEFEAVDSVLEKGRFDAEDVMRMLRHLIQHRPYFKVLLAGSHTLTEFQHWASYLINVQVVKVDYLSMDEALQLITRPMEDFRLEYDREACARVLGLTRGHPHLVQLLCYTIISLKNEQPPDLRWYVTAADVEAAVPEALETGGFFFADIEQNQIDTQAAELLHFIAKQGEGGCVAGRERPLELSVSSDVIDQLLQRDLVEPVMGGGYRFQVELIRRWFARKETETKPVS
ncbi:MAG: hypothetical protein KDE51_12290, partial [Anaerolineales bacterium]|nr:hypothetical protein [Anaerolineales bacterium]